MKDIWLENQPQVVQDILPSLTKIPPAVFGKTIRRSSNRRGMRASRRLVVMLEHRALQTHQQIRTAHELPPALDRGVVGDAKISPPQLIFRVFEAVFNPGA